MNGEMTKIQPQYGQRSLETLLPSVAAKLGMPACANTLELPAAESWVVMVVDGLGFDLLTEHAADAPFLAAQMTPEPVVCGVPSTTATSLTSLGTGLTPGVHGVVGYTSRVPETGARLNALAWDQNVDPERWQPHPTMFERIAASGIDVSVVNNHEFADSGLTRCGQRGVPYIGINSSWERLEAIVEASQTRPAVVYGYEARLDHAGHKYGCRSSEWVEMLNVIDTEIQRLAEALDPDIGLIVTADHGMIDVPRDERCDISADSWLRDDVTLLAGEARFRQLYTRSGAASDVAARWQEHFGDRVSVRTREQCQEWLGPLSTAVAPRVGDVLVASMDDFAVFLTADYDHEHKMTGFHGSLTRQEMLVPLIIAA